LRDACAWSFGGEFPDVIVAAGVDHNDGRWTRRPALDPDDAEYCGSDCGSNAGSCVDIWAPSAHVISSNMSGDDLTCRLSGTSMAAPHTSGVVAIYLQSNPTATPAQVERALRSRGTWSSLQGNASHPNYIGSDSDNVVLYADTRSTGDTAPVAAFTATCPGRQCNLNAGTSTDDGSISSYKWRFSDGTIGTGFTTQHTFPADFTAEIVLKVTDGTGKTDHLLKTVTVNDDAPPVALFTYSCNGLSCSFNSSTSSDDHSISSRTWTFGDGSSGSGTAPGHAYASNGAYTVTLTVVDNAGQTGTKSELIGVDLKTPTNVLATASGATVTVTWSTALNADGYRVERKTSYAAWQLVQTVNGGSASSSTDNPSSASGVVLYRVFAKYGTLLSNASNHDVAFVGTFSDDPLVSSAPIRAEHITELRAAVNGLLGIANRPAVFSASELDPNDLRAQAVDDDHILTLMQYLNLGRVTSGLPPWSFSVVPGAPDAVRATQIMDLRMGVR
jgi:PKD repeat protein